MSDNLDLNPGTGPNKAASKMAAFSSDNAYVQLIELVKTTGSEGARTVVEDPTHNVHIASSALTPAAATTDSISAKLATDKLMNNVTEVTPKFAAIAVSTSGNNPIVAAVTGKKIRVLAYILVGSDAVNAKFQSASGGTDLTGLKYIAGAGGGVCAPFNPVGWFETASGQLLNLNLSGAVAVGGELVYVEI